MNTFGIAFKKMLIEKNLKQIDVVKRLGLSKNAVSQALSGDNISLKQMERFAEAIGCKVVISLEPDSE